MDTVYIVIPVYAGWNETRICLDAIRASAYRELRVFVVYHGDDPEIQKALITEYPETRCIPGPSSLWWAGATNLGIRAALRDGARYIMLLNHDCYVDPDTIGRLLAHARRAPGAIVAPIQKDFRTGQVTAVTAGTCFLLGFPTLVFPWKKKDLRTPQLLPTRLILGGRGALVPAGVFERVGFFDEVNLPSYYSDHDFYLRCRRRGVALRVATDCAVSIDNTRTTVAAKPGELSLSEFLQTLKIPRSHRNLRDLSVLFRFHHPVRALCLTGVALNLLRYSSIYACKRLHKKWTGERVPNPARRPQV